MDNYSRASNISLIESESSVISRDSSIRTTGTTERTSILGQNHPYYTRLSAQRLITESRQKKLYVDFSDCRVTTEQRFDLALVPQVGADIKKRRYSTSSEDSREFNFEKYSYSKPFKFGNKIMDDLNPCDPLGRNRSNWLKYFVLISITSVLYIYIQVLHSSDTLKRINKDVDKLKLHFDESKLMLNKIDRLLANIKDEQDRQQLTLKNTISKEIEKFGSDKTGRTDFALESTGGKIVQLSPGTENFEQAVSIFGMALCDGKHGPRAMIQADMSPGHCWAIKGTSGGAVIKLLGQVKIDSVTLEHISKNLSPTGEVSSAPKAFSVWGLNSVTDRGHLLGTFTYNIKGALVQTFPIHSSHSFEYVEFRILTNQGHPDFTCIYRFRVHGHLEKPNKR